uniref:VWFA domain-containing protein n=1 Tax=Plectus sambesii TaxID=2011161 RepID=A0A914WM09_9BILA
MLAARSVTAAACGKNATNDCDPAPPEPAPPTKCPGCVPNETVNLFANAAPLTPIFVVDTGSSRMQVGWSDFTSALVDKALPVAVSKFSNQDQLQFSVVPTNNPQQYTSVKSLEQLKSSLNSVQFTNGQSCDQPLMTALLSAANISGVTPTSPLTLLTDSSISDLSLTEQVIAVALRNEIPINVIVSSMTSASNCDCLCSSVNKGSDSLSALKRIAHLTKGIYLETSKGGDYVQAANLLASIMRYDSQHFSFVAFTSNAYKHDLVADSGIDRYDGIFAATQPMTVTFQIDGIYKSEMMVDTGLSKALAVVPYPGDAISMICNMPGNTQTRLVGWPIAYALLMHDLTKPADYSTSAPYGVPVYVVFRYSNEEMVRLAIDTVTITDSESGSALLSGRPSDSVITLPVTLGPFGEAQYNFTKVFGPFMPKCRYLDISISGVNVGGERLERLVQTTFLFNSMDKTPAQTWLSADCILGMFDCGGGQCIPAQMYKDCTLQCGSGADEALPNKGEPCSALSSDQMPTCKPLVPPCVSCAPDDLDTILNNRLPIMAGFVFDTDVRPAGGQSNFAAIAAALGAQISVLTKRFPNRLTNAFVVPLGEAPGTVSSFPPNNIQQTLLQLPETTSSCSKPLLAALNSSLQTATRESVITMYLTSTASDLQALDALLLSAVEKNIIINIVIGDVSCDCICSTNNKGGDTISALKKLAMVTHGSYFEVQNAAAYDGITRLTTGDLRPDSLLLSRSEGQNNITTIIPLDSGLSAATLLAQGILPRMFNADDQTVVTILDTDSSLAAALPLVVPSVQFKSSSAANGPVSTKIAGYGWPSALVTLSPNPFADKPLLTNSPINGMPLYALVSTSDASVLPIDVKKVHITDSLMGTELASGNVVSYANNGAPQYSFIYGPFSAPKSTNQQPLYFDVAIDARNVAGEDIRRVAKQAFIVRDKSTDIDDHLPGSCNSGEFDCGEGVCIDQSKYLDCVIDCADGIDEARPISSSSSLTCEPFPPKCTTGCVPTLPPTQLYANESALSAVFLLDTSLSMSAARGLTASAVQESLQKVINTFPKRIDKLILIPVAQVVLPATTFQNLTELTSRMLSTVSDSTLKCEKPLLQALINGIDSSSPSSVITLITDSSVSDLYQLNDVIDSAVSSGVQINVIVSDDDCNCVCTKDSKSPTSIDALKKLTRVTHGTFFEIAATNNAYHGAIAVTSESTRPDWVLLGDQVSNGTASISVALDRGLDTVTALSSGTNAHQNISAAAVQPVKNDVINEPNVNADQLPIVFPGSLTVNGATVGNGEVDTQIFGLGWPAALAALTSNPSAQTPAFVRQLVAGTNVYAVVGNSQSNILKLPILSIKLIDSITGQLIMEKIAKPYNNPAAPQYTYVTDNFTAPCSYFDIAIIAANAAGEIIERTAKSTFSLRDATDESLASIPGQCKVGEFDCGDKCIESYRYRDCIADCSNGLDEARTIPTVCAANSSDTWTCVPAPWPTTTPTAQPSSTTAAPGCNDCVPGEAFSDMPPVSAVVVVDLSSRMTNDFPLLADSLSTQLIAVAADWPNAIDSFIFVPIDTAMTLPTKTTDMSAFLQTLKGITTDGSTSCQKQLLTRLLTGIQAAKPKSVVTLVTSSGASDLSLLNS